MKRKGQKLAYALVLLMPLKAIQADSLDFITDTMEEAAGSNNGNCPEQNALSPVQQLISNLACPLISSPSPDFINNWKAVTHLFGIPENSDFLNQTQEIQAKLNDFKSLVSDFSNCLSNLKSGQHIEENTSLDFKCQGIGNKLAAHLKELDRLEAKFREDVCKFKGPDEGMRAGVFLGMTMRSWISTRLSTDLLGVSDVLSQSSDETYFSRKILNQIFIDTAKSSAEAQEGFDWLSLRDGLVLDQKKAGQAILENGGLASHCLRETLFQVIKDLKKSGGNEAEIKKLIRELRGLSSELKKSANPSRNIALKKKALNTLSIIGNLSWGLPNTSVGAMVTLANMVVHPFMPKIAREPLGLKVSSNGKQIKINSQFSRRKPWEASMGLFEIDAGDYATEHEGGHTFQSAALGPFYFPVIAFTYLLAGGDASWLWTERMATDLGEKTAPKKPEKVFGCSE